MARMLFLFTIICSVFSQHPMFIKTTIAEVLKYSWAVPFLYNIFKYGHSEYHKIIRLYCGFCILFIVYDILFVPKININLDSDVVNMLISFLVLVTSYLFWLHNKSEKFFTYICVALLISVIYVGFIIYISSLSVVTLDNVEYAYKSKNSIATIILSAIIICSLNIKIKSKILLYFSYLGYAFLIILIFLLKSRATLLGAIFVVVYMSVKFNNKKIKNAIAIALFVFIMCIVCDSAIYDVIVNKIILNNHSADDLSSVSSGRDIQIEKLWDNFEESPILGIGYGYIDSFPIQILVKFGIVGFLLMFIFIYKISKNVFLLSREDNIHLSSFLLLCVFLINALFEAYPPFGPGIKCSFLWMSIGFSCAEITNSKYYILDNESKYFCDYSDNE